MELHVFYVSASQLDPASACARERRRVEWTLQRHRFAKHAAVPCTMVQNAASITILPTLEIRLLQFIT